MSPACEKSKHHIVEEMGLQAAISKGCLFNWTTEVVVMCKKIYIYIGRIPDFYFWSLLLEVLVAWMSLDVFGDLYFRAMEHTTGITILNSMGTTAKMVVPDHVDGLCHLYPLVAISVSMCFIFSCSQCSP